MDYTDIPSCALFRHGTVIVRLKMEVSCSCGEPKVCPVKDYPGAVHRLPKCEQCSRTRTNSQYSDCDSGIVQNKCRPYRASAARSRYVNVCAAVCLLLLVGDLSPQSSAAPHRTRTMDRSRRSTQENQTWGNPCDLDASVMSSPVTYTPKLAEAVARQAANAFNNADSYKEDLAKKLHGLNFSQILTAWDSYAWMKSWSLNKTSWFREEAMPPEKVYGTNVDEEYLDQIMTKIDEVLPAMFKSLKIVVASLYAISPKLPPYGNASDPHELENKLVNTSYNVRSVLCEFEALMRSRNLEIMPLLDSEIKDYPFEDRLVDSVLVYRDTLNYLEYIKQVFEKMAISVPT